MSKECFRKIDIVLIPSCDNVVIRYSIRYNSFRFAIQAQSISIRLSVDHYFSNLRRYDNSKFGGIV